MATDRQTEARIAELERRMDVVEPATIAIADAIDEVALANDAADQEGGK